MTQRINSASPTTGARHAPPPGTPSGPSNSQAGFTLVELLLATAFISFILIFIVFALTQTMSTYNKGATMKEINQMARNAADVMGRDIRNTDIESVNVSALDEHRVCFGDIAYVWNVKDSEENKYVDNRALRFTRVRNPGGSMCLESGGVYPRVPVGVSAAGAENALIPIFDDFRIWVHDIDVTTNTALQMVTVKITLSTTYDHQPVDNPITGPRCSGDNIGAYCAVGTFETTVTTRNGGE